MAKGTGKLLERIRFVPTRTVLASKIKFDKNNPNTMPEKKQAGLDKSIKKYGFAMDPWLNDNGDGTYLCIDGEYRIKDLIKNKVKRFKAKIFKVKYSDVRILRQITRKLHGEYDKKKDAQELKGIFEDDNLEEFTEFIDAPIEDIQRILEKEFGIQFAEPESEQIPEPPKNPKSKPGEIYQLGNHRIMCGDCTSKENIEKLLDGLKVDQLMTDPPYGVDYVKKNDFLNRLDKGNRIQKAYANDEKEKDFRDFFKKFLEIIPFADYNTIYIFMGGRQFKNLILATEDAGIYHGSDLVWVKNNHVLGPSDYLPKHELCFYGWKGKHKFYGPIGLTTVLEYDKPLVNDLHPTMKPVDMFAQLIKDGSKKGALVYEPFLGSGTTLIAAEQTNRTCYGMELDPGYIDVIIQRWEKYTGKKSRRI